MTTGNSRKGSALLIVLGLLAFMIVSAVAFSAYMRIARLPSSYLRRTSASRQLAKAGLARAIDQIDRAIGNNPHPGVGTVSTMLGNCNVWTDRIFTGTNVLLETDETVPVLTLESLAYIPVPLVNAARYYSRRSPTGTWHSFGFDTGRFAYCAIDVSDYFDVNRMVADFPRSSSSNRRVTLSYLFENSEHTSSGGNAGTWDKFMENFRTLDEETLEIDFDSKVPLVSVADLNLALGKSGKAGMKSPFCEYVESTGSRAGFYNTQSETDEESLRRMTFVTDGWYPTSDEKKKNADGTTTKVVKYDLNDGANQPFTAEHLELDNAPLSDLVLGRRVQGDSWMKWIDRLSGLGVAALYDYLDPDRVPVSLGIPTVERVPMICGISPQFAGSRFSVTKVLDPANEDRVESSGQDSRVVSRIVRYRINNTDFLKGFLAGSIETLVAYPFLHPDNQDGSFTLDGRFSFFFTEGEPTLRTGVIDDVLHLQTPIIENSALDSNTGMMNVKLEGGGINVPKGITTEEDALNIYHAPLFEGQAVFGSSLSMDGNEFLRLKYQWTQTPIRDGGGGIRGWTPTFDEVFKQGRDNIIEAHTAIPAIKWNGREYVGVDDNMLNDTKLLAIIQNGNASGFDLQLKAAVWLRIRDKDGKVVDMVPACITDDKIQNQVNDPYPLMQAIAQQQLGKSNPLMLFGTGVALNFSINGLESCATPQEIKLAPATAIVADPRYNHAPEHWFKMDDELNVQNWLKCNQTGNGDRDADIFMATSDAGYMQSPYETMFLPRFANLISGGDIQGYYESPDSTVYTGIPDSFGLTRNQNLMWRTYAPAFEDEAAYDDLPWTAEGTGIKINPYSDSTNVLMAAFANTPIDWRRASTNVTDNGEDYAAMSANDFNKKYAFNEYSSDTKVAYRDLERIAGRFGDLTRSRKNWKTAWNDLGWDDDSDHFCGVDLSDATDALWSVDRKFLYGYWHDCFGTAQQLFLIIVRAEPMMMGGGLVGQTPPQLGSRAVALVWRDPTESTDSNAPHRTRVLFYRNLE